MKSLEGKGAFVTGGVSGIGLGLAQAFLERGMQVVVTFRRRDHLERALAALREHRERLHAIELDVTDRDAVRAAAVQAKRLLGKIHLLCNNAGANLFGPMDKANYADWDWVLDVNLGGVINGVVEFLPYLEEHGEGGHIVNVGSMASFIPGTQAGLYTTAKFAVRGLTECLRLSLGARGIGVSLLAPGLTATNMHEAPLFRSTVYGETALPTAPADVERIGQIHACGMDPLEVGRRTVNGILRNDAYIFTHSEFRRDLDELHALTVALLPNDLPDERRLTVERRRRENTARARELADSLDTQPKTALPG